MHASKVDEKGRFMLRCGRLGVVMIADGGSSEELPDRVEVEMAGPLKNSVSQQEL